MSIEAYEAALMAGVYELMEKLGRKHAPSGLAPGLMYADVDSVNKVMVSAIAAVAAYTSDCATDEGCVRFANQIAGFLAEAIAHVRDNNPEVRPVRLQ